LFELTVGSTCVIYGSSHVDDSLFLPFQRGDLHYESREGEVAKLMLASPASIVGRRLDLLGFTLAAATATYRAALPQARENCPAYDWAPTLADWQRRNANMGDQPPAPDRAPSSVDTSYVFEETLLGFPGGGIWDVIRALADASPNDSVCLDLTDLAGGGYLAMDGSDVSTDGCRDPLIILTEGKSDARILRAAIDTLFPDYSDFIRFIDYDFAKAAGGVPEVVRFVKMFAGSGIKNRILALFDNDTAGQEARDQLGRLPANVFTMCLPPMPFFELYPTEGPDGAARSDINGRACSLELYLGREALTDPIRGECPVRWTGFIDKVGRYQGEVRDKGGVQDRFTAILKDVQENPTRRAAYDFSGVDAVFDAILTTVRTR
jgi:hypothetical protein